MPPMPNSPMPKLTDTLQTLPGGKAAPRFIEDWRYTSLESAIDITSRWIEEGSRAADSSALDARVASITQSIEANWLIIRNGKVDSAIWPELPSINISEQSAVSDDSDHPVQALSVALQDSLLSIDIHAATELPLALLIIDGDSDKTAVSSNAVSIQIAPGCDAEVIEYHASQGDADHFANSLVSIAVADAATLRYVRVQDRQTNHVHTGLTTVNVSKNASFIMSGFDLGGGLIRNDINVLVAGEHANAEFTGLYLAGDGQHIDNHALVDHAVGPATSSQEYRGILAGNSRCVWNGKAMVREGADGTDANQANHNMLLSDRAEINTKPELEIYADDVKCSHGTTVGQLDESALFYLQTRGIDQQQARQMLTKAFAADLVSRMAIPACSSAVNELVEQRLQTLVEGQ